MIPRMNLTPLAFRKKLLVRKRIRQWMIPCGLALTVSLLLNARIAWNWTQLGNEVRALTTRLEPMEAMSSRNDELTRQLKELAGHESVLHEIVGVQQPLSLLAVISQSAGLTGNRLQIRQLNVQQTSSGPQVPAANGTPAPPPTSQTDITITGFALEDTDVARFVQSLTDSKAFQAVELRATVTTTASEKTIRQYEITCRR